MTDLELLAQLGRELDAIGWHVAHCLDEDPPHLRVRHPRLPTFGESVTICRDEDGKPWMHLTMAARLAPADNVLAARDAIVAWMRPFTKAGRLALLEET